MKSLKIILISLISLFLITFLVVINSTSITLKIFEYASKELPLKYDKVEGSLYTGIKIFGLNYDDMVKAEMLYIKPSLLSLLVKEIYIYDLVIDKIVLENKLFEMLKTNNSEEVKEEKEEFNIPFSLYIKNFEASLFDFTYEEQKIDEILLKSKDISSNLKDFISADIFTNIKSDLANLEANIALDTNSYKVESKIDLNKEIVGSFFVEAKGDLEKVDFKVNTQALALNSGDNKLDIKNLSLLGNYDIQKLNLEISSLNSTIRYGEISSNISAKVSMLNNDINSMIFDANLDTQIKKSIFEALQKDLHIKSNLSGNLKEVKFTNALEQNQIDIQKSPIQISSSILDGIIKIENEDIDVLANFSTVTNLASQKSKIELKLNTNSIENLSISAKTVIENLKYDNLNLKPIGDINITSFYKKDKLNIDLNSKVAKFSLLSKDFKKFIFDLNLKELNPNSFYELDKSIKISKIRGDIKGEFEKNLVLSGDLVLNDSFIINSSLKTNNDDFDAMLKSNSFTIKANKKDDITRIKADVKELNLLEKQLDKILVIPSLKLSGLVDLDLQISSNKISYELNSPKVSLDKESIEKISIKGDFKEDTVFLKELNFSIGKIYDVSLKKDFSLLNQAFFNINSFEGELNSSNISIKSSKKDKNIVLNINTKDLFIEHDLYGKGSLSSNLNINIDEESRITVLGDVKADNLKSNYNTPAMSISKDRDIIFVSKDDKVMQKDYFLENIALDIHIFAEDIKYSAKNIDLKASIVLNIKKEFSKALKIYGSVGNVKGTFSELGRDYKIEDSNIYFRGLEPIDPILDIKASVKVDNVDISIIISGTLSNPRINLNSNPMMNQKDILSYLIYGTSFSKESKNSQSKQSQASLFLLNELSKDYAKELGVDMIYFQYDPTTQYIETHIGKDISEKSKVVLKNKANSGQIVFMRELIKLWNIELGFEEETQSIDLIYKKRY